jgi:sirohydrochlorin ferrochelatase
MKAAGATTGIILFAHGSSVEEANQSVYELAGQIQSLGPFHFARAAFLELAHPDLGEAMAQAVQAGAERVIVIPYFLTMGIHLRRDLPNLIAPLRARYPQLAIDIAKSLEGHPLMAAIVLERIREALEAREVDR